MTIEEYMRYCHDAGGSDLHITVGLPPVVRVNGRLERVGEDKLTPADTEAFARQLLSPEQMIQLREAGEMDFSLSVCGRYRFRVNVYRQRGSWAIAMRLVNEKIKTLE